MLHLVKLQTRLNLPKQWLIWKTRRPTRSCRIKRERIEKFKQLLERLQMVHLEQTIELPRPFLMISTARRASKLQNNSLSQTKSKSPMLNHLTLKSLESIIATESNSKI